MIRKLFHEGRAVEDTCDAAAVVSYQDVMRSSKPSRLDMESSSFRRDVEKIKDNHDTLYALERKINHFLETPKVDRYYILS